jgi:hypothetical protein
MLVYSWMMEVKCACVACLGKAAVGVALSALFTAQQW